MSSPRKRVLVVLAQGFEEIEALTTVDILRRAAVEVTVASVAHELSVTGSRGVTVVADALLADVKESEMHAIVLPGGLPGARNLASSENVLRIVRSFLSNPAKYVAAICAAPAVVLNAHGFMQGREGVCHPNLEGEMCPIPISIRNERVFVDGNLITSRGPGTAADFAFTLVAHLAGEARAREVAAPMLYPDECRAVHTRGE